MYVPDSSLHRAGILLILTSIITLTLSSRAIGEYIWLWKSPQNSLFAIETDASRYNESLTLAHMWEYEPSKAILEDLVRTDPITTLQNGGDLYELYGDVLYLSSGSTGDVLKLYTLASTSSRSDRIERKIALLTVPPPLLGDWEWVGTGSLWDTPPETELNTGELLDVQEKYREILSDQSEAQRYMYPLNGIPRSETEQLSDIRAFLDEDVEYIDW